MTWRDWVRGLAGRDRGPVPVAEMPTALLVEALHAGATACCRLDEAALLLVLASQAWVDREDFRAFVKVEQGRKAAGDVTRATVRWAAAVAALNAGRMTADPVPAAVLRIAAHLGDGVEVDLDGAVAVVGASPLGDLLSCMVAYVGR